MNRFSLIWVLAFFEWRTRPQQSKQKPWHWLCISGLKGNACKQELLWHTCTPLCSVCEEGHPVAFSTLSGEGATAGSDLLQQRHIFKLHPLPPPSGTSQQSVGKLQLWTQSFLRLSEEGSKGRGYLFLDRRVIVHSYTCRRENKSNICVVRWKLRVRGAGRWGLELTHLSCAGSWYRHPWYQRENIGAPLPRSWGLVRSGHVGAAAPRPPALLKPLQMVCNEAAVCDFTVWQL